MQSLSPAKTLVIYIYIHLCIHIVLPHFIGDSATIHLQLAQALAPAVAWLALCKSWGRRRPGELLMTMRHYKNIKHVYIHMSIMYIVYMYRCRYLCVCAYVHIHTYI